MSKTPRKNKSEVEYLRGEVKRLTSVNKRLRRENRDLRKKEHLFENLVDTAIETTDGDIDLEPCEQCGKGEMYVVDLKFVKYQVCNLCGHKEKL